MAQVWSKMGSCQACMSLTAAFLALSLLVLALGTTLEQPLIVAIGQLASAAFGLWAALHAIFFLARRKDPAVHTPATFSNFKVTSRGCGCSGQNN
jgi:hypothetical protein